MDVQKGDGRLFAVAFHNLTTTIRHRLTKPPHHSLVPRKGTRIFDRRGFRRRGNAHLPAIRLPIE